MGRIISFDRTAGKAESLEALAEARRALAASWASFAQSEGAVPHHDLVLAALARKTAELENEAPGGPQTPLSD